jgi:dienelactone hydrolase
MSPVQIIELTPAFFVLLAYFVLRQVKRRRRARLSGKPGPEEGRYDPSAYVLGLCKTIEPALEYRARNKPETLEWQRALRAKLAELLGGLPDRSLPLSAEILETRREGATLRRRIAFQSRPGLTVMGYLLLPAHAKKPVPVVICLPGHGRGVDSIVGVDSDGNPYRNANSYQREFALQVVGHGMAALAIEPVCFGHRRDAATRRRGASVTSCGCLSRAALLMGQSLAGWRVGDVVRAIDWVATCAELDSRRVGCVGVSSGGMSTLLAAALDTRIRAALVSGYLTTFRDGLMQFEHCIDNYVPGIMKWAELHDIAGLVAPRPLFFESGDRDHGFPVEVGRAAFERIRRIYEALGAQDALRLDVFPGAHVFSGVQGLPFIARQLAGREASSAPLSDPRGIPAPAR